MTHDKAKKLDIPDTPGVYFWKEGRKVIYIGRATSLRDRVLSYFSADLIASRGPRIVDMVTRSTNISWQTTDSVLEAVIAEANLIKKYQPIYNVKEKDDRSWNYVVITREDLPRVLVVRGRNLDIEREQKSMKISHTFGPFPQGSVLREALRIIRKIFPFIDRSSAREDNYHFYRQIGLSPDLSSRDRQIEYRRMIRHLVLFFQGKKRELVRALNREMRAYARAREFERASETKKKILALEHIRDIALIKSDIDTHISLDGEKSMRVEGYDVAHISGSDAVAVMTVLIDGEIDRREYRTFTLDPKIGNNDVRSMREVLMRRLRHEEWTLPQLIVIDGGETQRRVAEDVVREYGLNIPVLSVVKDDRHRPREILGDRILKMKYEREAILVNAEAHRFAISHHRRKRTKRMKS